MSYPALRRLLFRFDPEFSHELGSAFLRALPNLPPLAVRWRSRYRLDDSRLAQSLLGRSFENPIGLAAGFDKDARMVRAWPLLGFGFAELGTVTPLPQKGNPRPRLFRHAAAASLQNAMGFNNAGGAAFASRLRRVTPCELPLGVNIGKNKVTPPDRALDDYAHLLETLGGFCDYWVMNLSSPNTPGLRDLQSRDFLRALLRRSLQLTDRPVLVKLSPDLDDRTAVDLSLLAVEEGAAGVILTNTTTRYGLLPGVEPRGGLSGAVLSRRSRELLAVVAEALAGEALLVSVGGVGSGREVYRRLLCGASLVQVYTALVFEGPGLIRRMLEELLECCARDGVRTLAEVVGADPARGLADPLTEGR